MLFWSTGLRNRESVRRREVAGMTRVIQSIPTRWSASTRPSDRKRRIMVSLRVPKHTRGHTTDHDGFLEESATTATTLMSILSESPPGRDTSG